MWLVGGIISANAKGNAETPQGILRGIVKPD